MVSVVIHCNMGLDNQTESAGWLRDGFKAHGINAEITGDRLKGADIHIVQGPWYAYNDWIGKPNVLFLNRCYFGHPRWDVSIGWLNPDGTRDFRNTDKTHGKGSLPDLKPLKPKRRAVVVFGDYGRDPKQEMSYARRTYDSVFYRAHPSSTERTPYLTLGGELNNVWEIADCAVGYKTTALIDAEINGLHVHSTDPQHVVHHDGDRQQWINRLSWANWNHEEIKRGYFWEHLCL